MSKWEVGLKSGTKFIVNAKDGDLPRVSVVEGNWDSEKGKSREYIFMTLGYENALWKIEDMEYVRPLLDDLTEAVINAVKKENQ